MLRLIWSLLLLSVFAGYLFCGCAQAVPEGAPDNDVAVAPIVPTTVADFEPAHLQQALDIVWFHALQEKASPKHFTWARGQGGCGGANGMAFSDDTACIVLPDDNTFPKSVFVHELIHLYIWRHGISDAPSHTTGVWLMQPTLVEQLNFVGIDGESSQYGHRFNRCGQGAEQACNDGSGHQCDPGFFPVTFDGQILCTTSDY